MGLSGRPVAMVPNRDSAYVTGDDDEVGLAMLAALAAPGLEESYRLSGIPLVLGRGHSGWTEGPRPLSNLPRPGAGRRWARSTPNRSSCSKLSTSGRRRRCSWPASRWSNRRGVGALCVWARAWTCPVTRQVVFVPEGRWRGQVGSWEQVREVVGDLEPTELIRPGSGAHFPTNGAGRDRHRSIRHPGMARETDVAPAPPTLTGPQPRLLAYRRAYGLAGDSGRAGGNRLVRVRGDGPAPSEARRLAEHGR